MTLTSLERNQLYFYIYGVLQDFPADPKSAATEIMMRVVEVLENKQSSKSAAGEILPTFKRVET